jgi:hypothetical protein
MPWIRRVHVVSPSRAPNWLEIGHSRIHWLSDGEILPAACLPTFNSHAIETSLHRIEGLSEHFVYFNDDYLVIDDLAPSDFVNENGTLNAYLQKRHAVHGKAKQGDPDYLNAARNSARLLHQRYGYYPTRLHSHSPYALSVSLLRDLESEFPDDFEQTRRAQFRSVTDLNVAAFMVHHYGFIKRSVTYAQVEATSIASNDPQYPVKLGKLIVKRREGADSARFLCLNETGEPAPTPQWRREIQTSMRLLFPAAAPWEVETDCAESVRSL